MASCASQSPINDNLRSTLFGRPGLLCRSLWRTLKDLWGCRSIISSTRLVSGLLLSLLPLHRILRVTHKPPEGRSDWVFLFSMPDSEEECYPEGEYGKWEFHRPRRIPPIHRACSHFTRWLLSLVLTNARPQSPCLKISPVRTFPRCHICLIRNKLHVNCFISLRDFLRVPSFATFFKAVMDEIQGDPPTVAVIGAGEN